MQIDGTGLTQLSRSKPDRNAKFAEYFYEPRYSPDGTHILVLRYDNSTEIENSETEDPNSAVIMSSNGSGLRVVTKGKPLGWADSGKAIFVDYQCIAKYELGSGKNRCIKAFDDLDLLGELYGTDTLAVDSNGWLGLITVTDSVGNPARILPFPTTMTVEAEDLKSIRPDLRPEAIATLPRDLKLQQVASDRSGSYLLLRYRAVTMEVLQVVKIK